MGGCHNPDMKNLELGNCACDCNDSDEETLKCDHGFPLEYRCILCRVEQFSCKSLEDRIEKLEKFDSYDCEVISNLIKRIEKLEETLSNSIKDNLLKNIEIARLNERPHKCPVCEGQGKDTNRLVVDEVKKPSTINMKNPDCHACNGKGIVWG